MALAPDQITPELLEQVDAWYWCDHQGILLDGRPLDFRSHPYQVAWLQEDAPVQCRRKGAQVGGTSIDLLKTLHGLIYGRYPQGAIYLMPTRDDVSDFSKGRLNPLISDNPQISRHVQDTDAANIKRIAGAMLYFRGTKSRSQLKSVPADKILYDEIDEMAPDMVDLAEERLSHSSVKERTYNSTPTLPDYGIDRRWQISDQRLWRIKCRSCGRLVCMEEEIEERGIKDQRILIRVGSGNERKVIRACPHCQREINPLAGKWVARCPDNTLTMVGWWISQLNSLYVDPARILQLIEDPRTNITELHNSKFGMPYVEAANRLSIQDVLDCCANHGISTSDRGPCTMGVDQGKNLHVVIGRRDGADKTRIVHIGEHKGWSEMDGLIKSFHVSRCVVDALPETRNARDLARRFPGKVFLNYYNEHQKGQYKWDEQNFTVQCNRTESLDASHIEIRDRLIVLPRQTDIVDLYAKHCHNTAKKLIEDEESGSRRYVYLTLGPDHLRHATNYECIARSRRGPFDGCDLS